MGDNIKTDLKEQGRHDVEWTHLVQNTNQWQTLLKTVMNA
jgi:hypothetical protein